MDCTNSSPSLLPKTNCWAPRLLNTIAVLDNKSGLKHTFGTTWYHKLDYEKMIFLGICWSYWNGYWSVYLQVCESKSEKNKSDGAQCKPQWAALLDTKGPEIRTAMLKDHKSIDLVSGQSIIVEAVGDRYTSFEGYKNDNETRIGLSYSSLCKSVEEGDTEKSQIWVMSMRPFQ